MFTHLECMSSEEFTSDTSSVKVNVDAVTSRHEEKASVSVSKKFARTESKGSLLNLEDLRLLPIQP